MLTRPTGRCPCGTLLLALPAAAAIVATAGCDFFLLQTGGELIGDSADGRDDGTPDVPDVPDSPDDGAADADGDDDGAVEDVGPDETADAGCATYADCDDGLGCTWDRCSADTSRCSHSANAAWCPSGMRCDLSAGCVVNASCGIDGDCNDDWDCTVDRCVGGTRCAHDPRDADGDGMGDFECRGGDCDDSDPEVRPLHPEICRDLKDNDCDGRADYLDESCPAPHDNDTCARALPLLPGDTSVRGDSTDFTGTVGTARCGGGTGADAFYSLTLGARSQVTLDTIGSDFDTVLSITTGCGLGEIACNDDRNHDGADGSRIVLRSLEPGTYVVVVDGRSLSDRGPHVLNVAVDLPPDEPATCDEPIDVTEGGAIVGFLPTRDPLDLASFDGGSCGGWEGQQERFRLDVRAGANLRISSAGTTIPSVVYVRDDGCWNWPLPSEVACRAGPAGTGATVDLVPSVSGRLDFTLDTDAAARSGAFTIEVKP